MTRALRPFDLEIVTAPGTLFSGTVTVDGRAFTFDALPGLVAHYWGARLPRRWHWVSVNAPAFDVDATVSPLNGLVRSSGVPGGDVDLLVWAPSGGTRLRFSAPRAAYNDLGEGILQTLVGTLEIGRQRHDGIEVRGAG